jgi:hypothetical protein
MPGANLLQKKINENRPLTPRSAASERERIPAPPSQAPEYGDGWFDRLVQKSAMSPVRKKSAKWG